VAAPAEGARRSAHRHRLESGGMKPAFHRSLRHSMLGDLLKHCLSSATCRVGAVRGGLTQATVESPWLGRLSGVRRERVLAQQANGNRAGFGRPRPDGAAIGSPVALTSSCAGWGHLRNPRTQGGSGAPLASASADPCLRPAQAMLE
jgi:hypothetical protein